MASDLTPDGPTDDLVPIEPKTTGGTGLTAVTNGSTQRLLRIAKANGWGEIAADCRAALQYRSGERGELP